MTRGTRSVGQQGTALIEVLRARRGEKIKTRRESVGQSGAVLLEVLISGIVLGIVIMGVSLMTSLGQTMVVAQGDEYVALYLAQQRIEEFIATGFTSPLPAAGTTTDVPPSAGQSGTQTFTRQTTITRPDANTEQVSVTVTPDFGKADAVTLTTVLKKIPS